MSFISLIASKYKISKSELEELFAESNDSYATTPASKKLLEDNNIEKYSVVECKDKKILVSDVRKYLKASGAVVETKAAKAPKAPKEKKTVENADGLPFTPAAKKLALENEIDYALFPSSNGLKVTIADVRKFIADRAEPEAEIEIEEAEVEQVEEEAEIQTEQVEAEAEIEEVQTEQVEEEAEIQTEQVEAEDDDEIASIADSLSSDDDEEGGSDNDFGYNSEYSDDE